MERSYKKRSGKGYILTSFLTVSLFSRRWVMKNLGVWHLVLVVFIATYAVAAGAADFQITTTVFKTQEDQCH